ARARQTAAKGILSNIFVAERSFFGEYGTYLADLPTIGFGIDGYVVQDVFIVWFQPGAGVLSAYGYYVPAEAVAPNYASYGITQWFNLGHNYLAQKGYLSSPSICAAAGSFMGTSDSNMASAGPATTTDTFEARAIGCPLNNIPY